MSNSFILKEEYEEQLENRWSWLTKDIIDEDCRVNTNLVLENSYKKMVENKSLPAHWLDNTILSEEVIEEADLQKSGAVGDYVIPKVMFPVIRRVIPELIANKLVSVQPLTAPTGVIYYITYKYSNEKGGVLAGTEASFNANQTDPAYSTYYTSEKFGPYKVGGDNNDKAADLVKFLGDDAGIAATYKRIEIFNKDSGKALLVKHITADTSASLIKFSSEDGGTELATLKLMNETTVDGTITIKDAAKTAIGAVGENADAELEVFIVYNQEGTSHIPSMQFDIEHMDVNTTERKMKMSWTKEAEQDMQAYHKINVEQELVKVSSVQTNYEIDREIVNKIDDLVISNLTGSYDWTNPEDINGTMGNYLDKHRALAQKLYLITTKIAQYNRIAPGDWAVVNPKVASVLQMLPDWKVGEINSNKSTFYNAGLLGSGAVSIYVDPNRMSSTVSKKSSDDITVGYKPKDTTYGAGLVYSPYANWMSSTVINPDNFNSVRGTFSRYAITATPRAEYNYGRLTVTGLDV